MKGKIGSTEIHLVTEDITLLEVDAFVFYARPDLKLGSGFGSAINIRGGPGIQEELDKIGKASVGQAVVTSGGKLKAKNIIHAVGPAFQEMETEKKLVDAVRNVLKKADELGADSIAMPPMGSGFYGVAPEMCARIQLGQLAKHLKKETGLKKVFFCLPDHRDMEPFEKALASMQATRSIP